MFSYFRARMLSSTLPLAIREYTSSVRTRIDRVYETLTLKSIQSYFIIEADYRIIIIIINQ